MADEGGVELDDVRLKPSERRQAGVTGAQVVDRDSKAELAELGDLRVQSPDSIERCALRDLEHDPARQSAEGRLPAPEVEIVQLIGVDVDEQSGVGRRSVGG